MWYTKFSSLVLLVVPMECGHLVISRNPNGRGLENIFRAIAIRTNQPKIQMVSDCSVDWGLVGTGNNMENVHQSLTVAML